MRSRFSFAAAFLAAATMLTGCAALDIDLSKITPVAQQQTADPGLADSGSGSTVGVEDVWALLDALPVKGRAPKTGYSRSQFGRAWTDDVDVEGGGNSCDQRSDVLIRDLTDIVFKDDGKQCTVMSGILDDPYTGQIIHYQRGRRATVDVDHAVALRDAWVKGAQQLTARDRQNLAGDPLNLLAVDSSANRSKGSGDAATWLPANKASRVGYVTRQIQVKTKYRLWVTKAEKAAMIRVLNTH